MNKNQTNISLELLLLNDLLRTKVIDKSVYDMAVQKITTTQKEKQAAQPGVSRTIGCHH